MILVDISGASAAIRKQSVLTAGMVGASVKFRFDDDWEGLAKTAVFRSGDVTKDAIVNDSVSKIPHEVLILGLPLEIGVYGTKDDGKVVIPTVWAKTNPVKAGADPSGDEGVDPSLPIWAEIQEEVEQIKENGVGGITEEQFAELFYQALDNALIDAVTEESLGNMLDGFVTPDRVADIVIDDEDISTDKTWSSEKISDAIAEQGGGGGITEEELDARLEGYVTYDDCYAVAYDVVEYEGLMSYEVFYDELGYALNNTSDDGGYKDIIIENVIKALPIYDGEVVE